MRTKDSFLQYKGQLLIHGSKLQHARNAFIFTYEDIFVGWICYARVTNTSSVIKFASPRKYSGNSVMRMNACK